jgi:hypothetical protein
VDAEGQTRTVGSAQEIALRAIRQYLLDPEWTPSTLYTGSRHFALFEVRYMVNAISGLGCVWISDDRIHLVTMFGSGSKDIQHIPLLVYCHLATANLHADPFHRHGNVLAPPWRRPDATAQEDFRLRISFELPLPAHVL